jgi:hypothetical protein
MRAQSCRERERKASRMTVVHVGRVSNHEKLNTCSRKSRTPQPNLQNQLDVTLEPFWIAYFLIII